MKSKWSIGNDAHHHKWKRDLDSGWPFHRHEIISVCYWKYTTVVDSQCNLRNPVEDYQHVYIDPLYPRNPVTRWKCSAWLIPTAGSSIFRKDIANLAAFYINKINQCCVLSECGLLQLRCHGVQRCAVFLRRRIVLRAICLPRGSLSFAGLMLETLSARRAPYSIRMRLTWCWLVLLRNSVNVLKSVSPPRVTMSLSRLLLTNSLVANSMYYFWRHVMHSAASSSAVAPLIIIHLWRVNPASW